MQQGIVYLLGAGPGNPGLMTVRGKELIESAQVIVYDALCGAEILDWAPPACEKIFVGKRADHHAMPQEQINKLLVQLGKQGKRVVRLKGGDPYVFGRGGEEAAALAAAGIPFEVIPGISSALAGPSMAGIPVTHRGVSVQFSVFTGHEATDKTQSALDLPGIARAQGTKIMLMGMHTLGDVVTGLLQHGQDPHTPAAAIQWATTGRQRTVVGTVADLPQKVQQAGLGAPAVVIIGEIVNERPHLNWFERLPLFGKRIAVTRTRPQASELSRKLRALGAEVLELPTVQLAPPDNKREFAESVVHAHSYDWLIFSSPNAVERFFTAFFAVFNDIRSIGGARIAAMGSGTQAKLREYGLAVDLVPAEYVAEGLVKAFQDAKNTIGSIEHCTMLWVHGADARRTVYEGLNAMGAIVDECVAYKTEPAQHTHALAALHAFAPHIVTFTSALTAENFCKLAPEWPAGCQAAAIGPITAAALDRLQHPASVVADPHDIDGLVQAVLKIAKNEANSH